MLEAIRKRSASIVFKALMILLVLSFGVWGVADVFSPGMGGGTVATVGDTEITAQDYAIAFEREVNRVYAVTRGQLDPAQARALVVPEAVVQRMIARAVFDQQAATLGLAVSEDLVRRSILEDPSFRNPFGVFDRSVFENALAASGLSEGRYVQQVRADLARRHIDAAVRAGASAAKPLSDALFRHLYERRIAQVARIDQAPITGVPDPDDPAMRAFHTEQAELFTRPETRAVTALILNAADLAEEMAVSAEEVQLAYDDRVSEFTRPERRTVQQIVLDTRDAAVAARQRIAGGADLLTVAEEDAGLDAGAVNIGSVTREELPLELADAAFALPTGEVSEPIQSLLGWHLVKVLAIQDGRTAALEQVETRLRREIMMEKATDALFDLANSVEDALAGGMTLEEAGTHLNVPVRRIASLDAEGQDGEGTAVADLPEGFVDDAFATEEGMESTLQEAGTDTYYIVRTDAVTPPTLRPFETVRDQVEAAWRADEKAKKAQSMADQIADNAAGGEDFAAAAESVGADVTTTTAFSRASRAAVRELPDGLVDQLLAAAPGEIVTGAGDGAAFAARVAEVRAADPAAQATASDALSRRLAEAVEDDLILQMAGALRRRYPATINYDALNSGY